MVIVSMRLTGPVPSPKPLSLGWRAPSWLVWGALAARPRREAQTSGQQEAPRVAAKGLLQDAAVDGDD